MRVFRISSKWASQVSWIDLPYYESDDEMLTASDMLEYLRRQPFEPFRIVMSSGEQSPAKRQVTKKS